MELGDHGDSKELPHVVRHSVGRERFTLLIGLSGLTKSRLLLAFATSQLQTPHPLPCDRTLRPTSPAEEGLRVPGRVDPA